MKDLRRRKEVQDWIWQHREENVACMALGKSIFPEISASELALQVQGLQVAMRKFPTMVKEGILWPPGLNLEQTSSEVTARYKRKLFPSVTEYMDLGCGFGVDAYFQSEGAEEVILVEQNPELVKLLRGNWKIWNRPVSVIKEDLTKFLMKIEPREDRLIYLDPARRDQYHNRKVQLEDLSPDIVNLHDRLLYLSPEVWIKLSPMLDLYEMKKLLPGLSRVWILVYKNEVKEVLIRLGREKLNLKINLVDLSSGYENELEWGDLGNVAPVGSLKEFLYIPHAGWMKSGAFARLCEEYKVKALHTNSHLFTSENYIQNFPGRSLQVEEISPKKLKKNSSWNIISRNHPLRADQAKSKYKLRDGGKDYLIFTRDLRGSLVLKGKTYPENP